MTKKLILISYIMLSSIFMFSAIDSTQVFNAINTGSNLAISLLDKPVIPGVPNRVLQSIILAIGTYLWAFMHGHKVGTKAVQNASAGNN